MCSVTTLKLPLNWSITPLFSFNKGVIILLSPSTISPFFLFILTDNVRVLCLFNIIKKSTIIAKLTQKNQGWFQSILRLSSLRSALYFTLKLHKYLFCTCNKCNDYIIITLFLLLSICSIK